MTMRKGEIPIRSKVMMRKGMTITIHAIMMRTLLGMRCRDKLTKLNLAWKYLNMSLI